MAKQTGAAPNPGTLAQVVRSFQLVWRLMGDPRVPVVTKLIVPGVIFYVLLPLDIIPDLVPIIGQLDDLAVIFFGIRFFIEMCPADVVMEHRRALEGPGQTGRGEYVDATYRVVDDEGKRR